MSLSIGRAKLTGAHKDLMLRWDATRIHWNDVMSQNLEDYLLAPLEPKVRAAVVAMEKMGELLAKAKRECE